MQKSEQIGSTAVKVTVIIILLVIFVGMAISLSIAQNVNQPLSQLRQKTKEIAHGNFGESLSISSPAEIGELAKAFNLMCNKLKELDEMKSDFLSRISHELRTPLTSIKEADSLLLDGIGGNITHKQRRLLTIIKEECDKLINSINALLSLSRIQAGMMTYNFEPSSLASVINQSVTEIEPLIGHKRIQLNTEITKDLPHVRIDKEAVLQVLRNLLGNALKFTPEGGAIKLSAETIPKGSSTLRLVRGRIDKGVIMVSIADSGPGIPKENLAQIFDRFYQVKMQSPHTEGTGLGLSIAKHIVSAHRGKIWVESEPGKGSALTFTLPA